MIGGKSGNISVEIKNLLLKVARASVVAAAWSTVEWRQNFAVEVFTYYFLGLLQV